MGKKRFLLPGITLGWAIQPRFRLEPGQILSQLVMIPASRGQYRNYRILLICRINPWRDLIWSWEIQLPAPWGHPPEPSLLVMTPVLQGRCRNHRILPICRIKRRRELIWDWGRWQLRINPHLLTKLVLVHLPGMTAQ
nr:MAG TPA: hypothetical protein [Caudoviricetes sp.]DAM23573.1 MAG TPA: hypothetical protein [Caudoviricetes sp.]